VWNILRLLLRFFTYLLRGVLSVVNKVFNITVGRFRFTNNRALLKKRKVNGPKKTKKEKAGDPRSKCNFSVGQIIQHKKRPTIKYMLVGDPVSVRRHSYNRTTTMWKLKLFSLRGGKLGGRILTRFIAPWTMKDYIVVSDVDLSLDPSSPVLLPSDSLAALDNKEEMC
jgi:hypothetical protein